MACAVCLSCTLAQALKGGLRMRAVLDRGPAERAAAGRVCGAAGGGAPQEERDARHGARPAARRQLLWHGARGLPVLAAHGPARPCPCAPVGLQLCAARALLAAAGSQPAGYHRPRQPPPVHGSPCSALGLQGAMRALRPRVLPCADDDAVRGCGRHGQRRHAHDGRHHPARPAGADWLPGMSSSACCLRAPGPGVHARTLLAALRMLIERHGSVGGLLQVLRTKDSPLVSSVFFMCLPDKARP